MKTILVDAVHTFVIKGEIFKELHDLLETYSNNKIIVTNADNEQMETFGLTKLPYDVFTLRHNPDKPNPVYFKELLKQYSLSSEDCIYFEHNEAAVKSAKSVGITSYHYNHEKKDLAELKKFLDNNL